MRNHKHLSEEDIVRIAKEEYLLFVQYPEMKTIFDCSMRSTIDWEIKKGMLI